MKHRRTATAPPPHPTNMLYTYALRTYSTPTPCTSPAHTPQPDLPTNSHRTTRHHQVQPCVLAAGVLPYERRGSRGPPVTGGDPGLHREREQAPRGRPDTLLRPPRGKAAAPAVVAAAEGGARGFGYRGRAGREARAAAGRELHGHARCACRHVAPPDAATVLTRHTVCATPLRSTSAWSTATVRTWS